ncbi:MAG: Hsp20/alpha crystallin family protein, partial [Clostridiales bacterium]|nr:Hsp20/alpha crystallin family protein [Clostridiales bacterium]
MYTMIPTRHMNDFDTMFYATDNATLPFRTDLQDTGDSFILTAELPGFDKEDIHLSVNAGVLTIQAQHSADQQRSSNGWVLQERHTGSYSRTFTLNDIQEDAITANYKDGILTLTLPKARPAAPQRREIT